MSVGQLSSRQVVIGMAIAAALGLIATFWGVFSPQVLEHYSDSPDSVNIAQWAERATPQTMLGWWTGAWIQPSARYYRPLSSYLFWLEFRLFGWNFQGYVMISWIVHALISALLFLLALRLFPGSGPLAWAIALLLSASVALPALAVLLDAAEPSPWVSLDAGRLPSGILLLLTIPFLMGLLVPPASERLRVGTALLAVLLFNLRLPPEGPYWPLAPVAYAVVAWWPGQTDQMSLLCSLPALLALDRWLTGQDRRGCPKALAWWIVALLFKEMAVIIPVLAVLLAIYRDGTRALTRPRARVAEADGGPPPGSAWLFGLAGGALAAGFLVLRSVLIPEAWGVEHKPAAYYLHQAVFLLISRPYTLAVSHNLWVSLAAVFCAVALVVWVRAPRRPSVIWLILAMVLVSGLLAEFVGGNFALVTLPDELVALGTLTLFTLGLIVLVLAPVAWVWLLLAMAVVVHLPLLWVWGPHYFYWPAAFWGLFNAGLWHHVLLRHQRGELQWKRMRTEERRAASAGT